MSIPSNLYPQAPCRPLHEQLKWHREMKLHRRNLEQIAHQQETEALAAVASHPTAENLPILEIVNRYRELRKDKYMSVGVSMERAEFWLNIARLAMTRALHRADIMPRRRRSIAARALLRLTDLAPELADFL